MEQPTSKARRVFRLVAGGVAALVVLYYATVTLRPNPVAKAMSAHEARGRELGFLRADAPVPPLPPMSQAGVAPNSPKTELWRELGAGLSGGLGAVATFTFRAPGDDDAALTAIRSRSLFQPAIMSRLAGPPPAAWASDTAQAEARRADFEALLTGESAIAQDDSIPLTGHSDRVATIIAYLALHGESAGARKVLDRFLEGALGEPHFYLNDATSPWEAARGAVPPPPLLSGPDRNSVIAVAIFLDQAGVDVAYLDHMAEALEQDIPPPEQRAWMMERSQYLTFAMGEVSLDTGAANLTPRAIRSIPGGQYLDGLLARVKIPLMKAYYRDSFAAWMRGDIPAAVSARKRFALFRDNLRLRGEEPDWALPFPHDVQKAAWLRGRLNPPKHMLQVETARFVVAALRFRHAEGRWPAGADELFPKWLPADSIGGPEIRWGVIDLPPLEIHGDSHEIRLMELVRELESKGAPPESLAVRESAPGNLHLGNRPMFWRIGPADKSSLYLGNNIQRFAQNPSAVGEPPKPEEFGDDAGIWREARGYTMLRLPDAAALKLLAPKE